MTVFKEYVTGLSKQPIEFLPSQAKEESRRAVNVRETSGKPKASSVACSYPGFRYEAYSHLFKWY